MPESSSVFEAEPLMLVTRTHMDSVLLKIDHSPYTCNHHAEAQRIHTHHKYARETVANVLMMQEMAIKLRNAQLLISKHARYVE